MQLAANDDNLSPGPGQATRDDRLQRARKLLRPIRKAGASHTPNTAPILAASALAGAALLLATLVTGATNHHSGVPQAPTSGSDLAPLSAANPAIRGAVPATPQADFELSGSPGNGVPAPSAAAPAEAAPAVRDAVLIGTESEVR